MSFSPYWRAEVFEQADVEAGKSVTRKLFAGIYDSRQKAEKAAQRKCRRINGFGFYVHALDGNSVSH